MTLWCLREAWHAKTLIWTNWIWPHRCRWRSLWSWRGWQWRVSQCERVLIYVGSPCWLRLTLHAIEKCLQLCEITGAQLVRIHDLAKSIINGTEHDMDCDVH